MSSYYTHPEVGIGDLQKKKKRRKRSQNWNQTSASKSLTEDKVITFLDQYFTDFEHNLRDNNFEKMNTSLVKNLITKFSKIFDLWEQNLIFQKSIDQTEVENIYKSMHHIFGTGHDQTYEPIDTGDFTLECNRCGETFPLRNNNCLYSYEVHSLSEEHLEFIRNLNDDDEDGSSASSAKSNICNDDFDYVDGYEQLFIIARCNLCYNRISFGDLNYEDQEAVVAKAIAVHLEAPSHRRNVRIFRENKRYVEEVDLKKNIFKCTLCERNSFFDALIEHFESGDHRRKVADTANNAPDVRMNSKVDRLPALQPYLNNASMKFKHNTHEDEEGVYAKLAKLCIDKEKRETVAGPAISVNSVIAKKQKQNNAPAVQVQNDSISVFDANCLIIKNQTIQCKICCAQLKSKSCFITHFSGGLHSKNFKLYISCVGDFVRHSYEELQCTLCNYQAKKYRSLFKHCRSISHLEKLKHSTTHHFPDHIIQRNTAEKIWCPDDHCTKNFSGVSQLLVHVRSIHGIHVK